MRRSPRRTSGSVPTKCRAAIRIRLVGQALAYPRTATRAPRARTVAVSPSGCVARRAGIRPRLRPAQGESRVRSSLRLWRGTAAPARAAACLRPELARRGYDVARHELRQRRRGDIDRARAARRRPACSPPPRFALSAKTPSASAAPSPYRDEADDAAQPRQRRRLLRRVGVRDCHC